jgi:hypothetical protein
MEESARTCVGVEGAGPTAAQCANYGTWNNKVAIDGGKVKALNPHHHPL